MHKATTRNTLYFLVWLVLSWIPNTEAADSSSLELFEHLSYDFGQSRWNWGSSTVEESGMTVRHRNGVLELLLERDGAEIHSPAFFALVTQYSVLAIRAKHLGQPLSLGVTMTTQDVGRNTTGILRYSFTLSGSGTMETVYSEMLEKQLRFQPPQTLLYGTSMRIRVEGLRRGASVILKLQYVKIADQPVILRLDGCNNDLGNTGANPECMGTPTTAYFSSMSSALQGFGDAQRNASLPIAKTFSCRLGGGERIRVEGFNFGPSGSRVLLGNKVCRDVQQDQSGKVLSCTTPPGSGTGITMELANGFLPFLQTSSTLFDYVTAPSPPVMLVVSNIGSRHLDLRWSLGADFWNNTMITGFLIQGRREKELEVLLRNATLRQQYPCMNSQVNSSAMRRFEVLSSTMLDGIHKESIVPAKEHVCDEMLESNDGGWSAWGGDNGELTYIVGNITTTTITDLDLYARYQFRIASLSEDRLVDECRWRKVDVYGRREEVLPNVIGGFSDETSIERTLVTDFTFESFSLNKTLEHGPSDLRTISGPRGSSGSEGHYGLVLVGTASIGGCNATSTCVDMFGDSRDLLWWKACDDEGSLDNPRKVVDSRKLFCFAVAHLRPSSLNSVPFRTSHIEQQTEELSGRDEINELLSIPRKKASFDDYDFTVSETSNVTEALGKLNMSLFDGEVQIPRPDSVLVSSTQVTDINIAERMKQGIPPCQSLLRLTSSIPSQVGAGWYKRRQLVDEGFETAFVLRMATPSSFCKTMNGIYTNCRGRGGSGLAFVIQNEAPTSLGKGEDGLGYSGINNSIALEFDTWFDSENLDPYENHISLHARSNGRSNSANHSYSLGETTTGVPDLTDGRCGIIEVRVTYEPFLDAQRMGQIAKNLMNVAHFLTDKFYIAGGMGTWGQSMGLLSVYLYDDSVPVLAVPLNLGDTLNMPDGRAWVGFSASTAGQVWQTHDVLAWSFSQLRQTHS